MLRAGIQQVNVVGHLTLFWSPSYAELVVKIRSSYFSFADVKSARETTLCSIRTLLKAFSSLVVVKNADASFIKSRSWQRFG